MKPLALILAGPIIALTACKPQPNTAKDREALRRADSAYSAAAQSRNLDALLALYASDAVMYPPNEPTVSGMEGVRQYASNMFKTPGLALGFTPVEVQVSSAGTMGYTLNRAQVTLTDSKGAATSEEVRDFHVWRKDYDGAWRILVDIWNSPTPLAAPASPANPRP